MIRRSISIPKVLWEMAKEKATRGGRTFSGVVRRLLEKWLNNEIDLE